MELPHGTNGDAGIGTIVLLGQHDVDLAAESQMKGDGYQVVRLHERVGLCCATGQGSPQLFVMRADVAKTDYSGFHREGYSTFVAGRRSEAVSAGTLGSVIDGRVRYLDHAPGFTALETRLAGRSAFASQHVLLLLDRFKVNHGHSPDEIVAAFKG
jgi:hypothetical protein